MLHTSIDAQLSIWKVPQYIQSTFSVSRIGDHVSTIDIAITFSRYIPVALHWWKGVYHPCGGWSLILQKYHFHRMTETRNEPMASLILLQVLSSRVLLTCNPASEKSHDSFKALFTASRIGDHMSAIDIAITFSNFISIDPFSFSFRAYFLFTVNRN